MTLFLKKEKETPILFLRMWRRSNLLKREPQTKQLTQRGKKPDLFQEASSPNCGPLGLRSPRQLKVLLSRPAFSQEPRYQEIDELYLVRNCQSTGFEAKQL